MDGYLDENVCKVLKRNSILFSQWRYLNGKKMKGIKIYGLWLKFRPTNISIFFVLWLGRLFRPTIYRPTFLRPTFLGRLSKGRLFLPISYPVRIHKFHHSRWACVSWGCWYFSYVWVWWCSLVHYITQRRGTTILSPAYPMLSGTASSQWPLLGMLLMFKLVVHPGREGRGLSLFLQKYND